MRTLFFSKKNGQGSNMCCTVAAGFSSQLCRTVSLCKVSFAAMQLCHAVKHTNGAKAVLILALPFVGRIG